MTSEERRAMIAAWQEDEQQPVDKPTEEAKEGHNPEVTKRANISE